MKILRGILVAALTLSFSFVCRACQADNVGAKVAITSSGIQSLIRIAEKSIIEDLETTEGVTIAREGWYDITNAKVSSIELGATFAVLRAPDTIELVLSITSINLSADWAFRLLWMSDYGRVNVGLDGVTWNLVTTISVNPDNTLSIGVPSEGCQIQIDNMTVTFTSSKSQVMATALSSIVDRFLQSSMKKQVEGMVCGLAVDAIAGSTNKFLRSLSEGILIPETPNIKFHFEFPCDARVNEDGIELPIVFFARLVNESQPDFTITSTIPSLLPSSSMFQLALATGALNTISYSLWKTGMFTIELELVELAAATPLFAQEMFTSGLNMIGIQLENSTIFFSVIEAPHLSIVDEELMIEGEFEYKLFTNGDSKLEVTASMETIMNVQVENMNVTGSASNLTIDIKAFVVNGLNMPAATIALMNQVTANQVQVLLPVVNSMMATGFEIPSEFMGLSFSDLSVDILRNYIKLAGSVSAL